MLVRLWAGAAAAAGRSELTSGARTLAELRSELAALPRFDRLAQVASLLVDGAQYDPDKPLPAGAVVDVLPPFAGG